MTHSSIKAVQLSPAMAESQFFEVSRWLEKWGIAHSAKFPYLLLLAVDLGGDLEVEFGDWIIYDPSTERVSLRSNEEFKSLGR